MRKPTMVIVFLALAGRMLCAADEPPRPADAPAGDAERLRWWREARFGMFIHWGPVSLKGTEIGWSRGAQVPADVYDNLYKEFNPAKFNADEWVSIAKAAGMKYMVLTSKHHDGFCLWDTKQTDYNIMNSPFKRDVTKELAEACRKQGLVFCAYHSICDWRHPDYPLGSPGGKSKKPEASMERYNEYLKNQLTELLKSCGPLGILWFDGEWEAPWNNEHAADLLRHCRALQPSVIINNRVGKGRHGMAGTTAAGGVAGDYDTPEQRVGGFSRERPWETCMTICQQWAWKPNDSMKSLAQCLQTLLQTVGGDGNLLFNVGPMPSGEIEPRQAERLREMGAWLGKHADGVYGTRGGPFKPGRWGASTCKGSKVYLFVMNWPADGPLVLPAIAQKITAWRALSGGEVAVEQRTDGLSVTLPAAARDAVASAIELTVEGKAFDIPPAAVGATGGSLAAHKPAKASNVYQKQAQHGPDKAVDDDEETRWATDSGVHQAWLEVDLGRPAAVGQVRMREYLTRVKKFELQYRDGEQWKTILSGTTIGADYSQTFEPVTAQTVRLNVLEATDGPSIWAFQLLAPKK